MSPTENGWNEYSRLVLEQLETLTIGIEGVRNDMYEMRQELAIMKAKEDKVIELRTWKEKIDEVTSPTQLKNLIDEVQDFREFKTKSVTIFMAVQTIMAGLIAWNKLF
tara:strand:+ start:251 stop:574 length:324 start_codon:yes stop_codon:yes gene_type:complete